jgi:hypothetical protein
MGRFIIRVELFDTNDGTSQEYETLHDEMAKRKFKKNN